MTAIASTSVCGMLTYIKREKVKGEGLKDKPLFPLTLNLTT